MPAVVLLLMGQQRREQELTVGIKGTETSAALVDVEQAHPGETRRSVVGEGPRIPGTVGVEVRLVGVSDRGTVVDVRTVAVTVGGIE